MELAVGIARQFGDAVDGSRPLEPGDPPAGKAGSSAPSSRPGVTPPGPAGPRRQFSARDDGAVGLAHRRAVWALRCDGPPAEVAPPG